MQSTKYFLPVKISDLFNVGVGSKPTLLSPVLLSAREFYVRVLKTTSKFFVYLNACSKLFFP